MPLYNAINTAAVESFVRKLLGIRNGGVVPTVSPELGVQLNFPAKEDTDAPAGYLPWGMGTYQAAVAGQYSFVNFNNGSTNQGLLIRPRASSGGTVEIWALIGAGIAGGALLAAQLAGWRDARRVGASFPLGSAVVISQGSTAVAPPGPNYAVARFAVLASVSQPVGTFFLPPGTGLAILSSPVNTDLRVDAEAFIRDLQPDELVV